MSFLEELEDQLKGTEASVAECLQRIEQTQDLVQSLELARDGLGQAAENIGELAKTIDVSAQSLREVADMLRVAVNVLERSDPELIHKELKNIKDSFERSSREQLDSTERVHKDLTDFKDSSERLSREQLDSTERMHKDLMGFKDSSESSAREQSDSDQYQRWLIYLLLALVTILLGFDLFPFVQERFFSVHG